MAHFAKIENGIVTDVVVVSDEHEADGEAYLNSLGLTGKWVQTSFSAKIRKKFAGIGDTYDSKLDVFKPSKPSDDATWVEEVWAWITPEKPLVIDVPTESQA